MQKKMKIKIGEDQIKALFGALFYTNCRHWFVVVLVSV